ncbi:toxin-immunity protein system imunity protein CdiI [Enterobacter cloacae]|uniref:toxin-immunity protein system imunity protein CdiI n=1 Tax=Enterobacter cloacae TaxID=550 RepID=UPI003906B13C
MFGIFSKGEPVSMEGELVQPSSIVINDYEEELHLPLSYWDIKDYKNSWLKSLGEGLSNKTHSALAVSMYEPEKTNFIFTWVLYLEDETVYVQNNVIFLEECHGFSPENINKFIESRTTHDGDGMKISEWHTDLNSVLDFYHSLNN